MLDVCGVVLVCSLGVLLVNIWIAGCGWDHHGRIAGGEVTVSSLVSSGVIDS